MKYLKISFLCLAVLAMIICACNRDEIFEREQYKHIVSLVSNKSEGIFNIFEEELDLSLDPSIGYIAASCGGAHAITEPVTIRLAEDLDLLYEYNYANFEMREDLYVKSLSQNRYSVNALQITIPAHERSGKMQIRVNAKELSPDSTYLIPFRITQTNCEINPDNVTLFYRVFLKNFYATNRSNVEYAHAGELTTGDGQPQVTSMTKRVFPLSGNAVRMFAGNQSFNASLINNWSLRVEIAQDGRKVTISSWGDSPDRVQVTQIDDDEYYPNIFFVEDLGYITYKTFLLCYEYREPFTGVVRVMKERLRLEYKPLLDKK